MSVDVSNEKVAASIMLNIYIFQGALFHCLFNVLQQRKSFVLNSCKKVFLEKKKTKMKTLLPKLNGFLQFLPN
jgi:hypothetical protein